MNLKEQLYIVTLADCGSVTKAAKQLGVTQPALSSYLMGVESGLGFPLFERKRQQLIPTYLGEVYLERARKILALGQEFDEQAGRVISGYQGRLRIGIPIRRSPHLIPSAMKIFRSYYPNIEVTLEERNQKTLVHLLETHQLDILLCNLVEPQPHLQYITLYRDALVFLLHADHPLCGLARYRAEFSFPWIDLRQAAQENFFLQHPGQSLRWFSDMVMREEDVIPQRSQLIRNIETAAQMAANGLGVSFCLESYLRHMLFVRPPKVFSVGSRQYTAEFSAVYTKDQVLPDYALKFIQIVKDVMSMEPKGTICTIRPSEFRGNL